jgi:hypothetical protein
LLGSCLVCSGLASLSYLLGAAVIFFDLPTATFLRRAFVGGATWYEHQRALPANQGPAQLLAGLIDKPGKTCDGFTLCTYGHSSQAALVNMRGEVVHRWHTPFSAVWPDAPHLRGRIDNGQILFTDGHVYPNGDLLVVMESEGDQGNGTCGCGVARLDKDSHVLWKYAANCHHYLDIGEDGTLYALSHTLVHEAPRGLEQVPTPCIVDFVEVISVEGKRLRRISLLEAFQNSPYAPLLGRLERPAPIAGTVPGSPLPDLADDLYRRDVLHMNAVKVLTGRLAPKFPLFRAGQLLISSRHLDAIAVLDPVSETIVWAARGPWRAQHDPSFLDNGHLLLFDNLGSPRSSRVLEYDPATQAFPWSYPTGSGAQFRSEHRGMSQRLANGNTLIVNSDDGEITEVTAEGEVVWACSCGRLEVYCARRYSAGQLPFLKEVVRARP